MWVDAHSSRSRRNSTRPIQYALNRLSALVHWQPYTRGERQKLAEAV